MKSFPSFLAKALPLLLCLILVSSAGVSGNMLSPEDEQLLERVQKTAFDFLWREANPENGLVKDRADNFQADTPRAASIASVGFALAGIPVAIEHKWIPRRAGLERARKTLQYFAETAITEKGFFYHFLGMNSGKRVSRCELSSIDTALLLAGAVVAREYFQDPAVTQYTNIIYDRMDFNWMLNGGKTLSMGWKPESGFLKERWSDYNEGILLTLLAIGAEKNPIPAEVWKEIKRKKGSYDGIVVVQSPPLFTHQYPHLYFDFRDKHDGFMDYFTNSVNASLANQKYCQDNASRYPAFKKGYWGLTASDVPTGYRAYGAEPGGASTDGTIAPTGAITSIMFTPELSLKFLRELYENEKDWIWGKYGFTDAFNLRPKWKANDALGIDQGAILLGIENYRTGLVWKLFNQAPEARRALERAGFEPGSQEISLPERPVYRAPQADPKATWNRVPKIHISEKEFLENGSWNEQMDLQADIQFAWDPDWLYFHLAFQDGAPLAPRNGEHIWRNDCFEIFLALSEKGFRWGDPRSVQLGFSPMEDLSGVKAWSWWKRHDPVKSGDARAVIRKLGAVYHLTGKVKWSYLGIQPEKGMTLNLTPAFHDLSKDKTEKKFTWYFVSKDGGFELGKVVLE